MDTIKFSNKGLLTGWQRMLLLQAWILETPALCPLAGNVFFLVWQKEEILLVENKGEIYGKKLVIASLFALEAKGSLSTSYLS